MPCSRMARIRRCACRTGRSSPGIGPFTNCMRFHSRRIPGWRSGTSRSHSGTTIFLNCMSRYRSCLGRMSNCMSRCFHQDVREMSRVWDRLSWVGRIHDCLSRYFGRSGIYRVGSGRWRPRARALNACMSRQFVETRPRQSCIRRMPARRGVDLAGSRRFFVGAGVSRKCTGELSAFMGRDRFCKPLLYARTGRDRERGGLWRSGDSRCRTVATRLSAG